MARLARTLRTIAVAPATTILVLGSLASCGESRQAQAARERALVASLVDQYFVSTRVEGDPLIDGTRIQMDFIYGIGVNAGCNTISGELVVDDGDKVHLANGSETMIGCGGEERDDLIGKILEEGLHASLDGDRLTLRSGSILIELRREATPPGWG